MRRPSSASSDGVPLQPGQVEAACRLHSRLKQWQLSESALLQLHERVPGFDAEASLLKTVAVNAIYGTQVYATVRMAGWVEEVMKESPRLTGPELVEKIAALPKRDDEEKSRTFISFTAKFCHFFVDPERYPIYDEAARSALKLHLGSAYDSNTKHPYIAFCDNLFKLRELSRLNLSMRELDHYLWLTGMYMRWLKQRDHSSPLVNDELLRLFIKPGQDGGDLEALLPPVLWRAD